MMKASNQGGTTSSQKFWIYILGGLAIIIMGLLIAILWRISTPGVERESHKTAAAQKIKATGKTALPDEAPISLVASYYQAIHNGDVSQVQSAWDSSSSQVARYAVQAVREFPVSDRCQLSQVEQSSSASSSGAILSALLQCNGPEGSQIYPITIHLKIDKTGAWKMLTLQDSNKGFLAQTGGVTAKNFIPDPVNTVYDFYDALKQQHCQDAARMRPDYKGCDTIEKVSHLQVKPLQIDADKAALQLDVSFKKKGKSEEKFNGYIWLKRANTGIWLIQEPMASVDKATPEGFMTDFALMNPRPLVDDSQKGSEVPNILPTQQPVKSEDASLDTAAILPTAPELENNLEGQQVNAAPFRSFGSDKILRTLWTPEQLRGNPVDKQILSRKDHPDYSPPLRQYPRYNLQPLPNYLRGSIRTVKMPDPDKKLVALTFDLCERAGEVAGYDAEVVNYLRSQQVPATFYAGGKWMRSHPEQTKQLMADPLFEIGNHAWTHGNMRLLTGQEMKDQVLWTQAQYELLRDDLAEDLARRGIPREEINRIPPVPLTFRYPYGTCSREALDFMGDHGLPSIQWNIVTADPWRGQTTDGIVKVILEGIKPGSIIIAHANGRGWKTSEALPRLIPVLRARGYRFATVTELLAEGKTVEAADSCYELRVGDNQAYDKKVGKGTD